MTVTDTGASVSDPARAGRDGVAVAVCQLSPRIGEVDGNLARMVKAVESAALAGARLVVLPELATTGYVFQDEQEARRLAEPLDGPSTRRLADAAAELDLVVVAGLAELEGDRLYNSAVVVDRTGLRAAYRKTHLWDGEKEIFVPGQEVPPVVETELGRVGVVICYDLEFPELMREVALRGADIVCAPTNWPAEPRPEGERPAEVVRVQASAAVNRVFVAVADRTGRERGVEWVSGSAIVAPDGYPLALAETASEQVLVAHCCLGDARNKRVSPRNDVLADRRPELYAGLLSTS